MYRIPIILFFIHLCACSFGQSKRVIDEQFLSNGKLIRLIENLSTDKNKHYALEFVNRFTNDTIVNFIDSVQHAPCSPLNSIFFVNDSIGFFTESGGCYASYNWLFRTTDRGLTWKRIESGSRTDGNSFRMLHNESFFMFDELKGIIIWEIEDGKLIYSLTSDGGINWESQSAPKLNLNDLYKFRSISFANDGQVVIVCAKKYLFESDRTYVKIIQSKDFGKSFHFLN